MKVTVVSATPKQLDSVGAWHTITPSSLAASVSTSSTPTVYLATMRSRCDACIIRRLIGVCRIEVPISATASRAASTTASSQDVRGNCQPRSPTTTSQPRPSRALIDSGGSSRGAKIRTFGLDDADMEAPEVVAWRVTWSLGGAEDVGPAWRLGHVLRYEQWPDAPHHFFPACWMQLVGSLERCALAGRNALNRHPVRYPLTSPSAWVVRNAGPASFVQLLTAGPICASHLTRSSCKHDSKRAFLQNDDRVASAVFTNTADGWTAFAAGCWACTADENSDAMAIVDALMPQ